MLLIGSPTLSWVGRAGMADGRGSASKGFDAWENLKLHTKTSRYLQNLL